MKRRRGFSLIEVLIALAILGIGIAALAQAVVNAVRATSAMESVDTIFHDVEFTVRQAILVTDREQFLSGGEIPLPDGTRARWDATIQETKTLDLFRVALKIQLPESSERPEFNDTVTFYLHRKGWMESIDRESLLTEKKEAREAARYRFR